MEERNLPLVSCIMPTANRRSFINVAIEHFLAQQYLRKELIILDDGEDGIGDLIPQRPEIRYFRDNKRSPLGIKRNRLCELASGSIIAHWDDDDWQSPNRLSYQVSALLESGANICGITRPIFFDPDKQQAWQYLYPSDHSPWLSGSTLCYRRSFWERHRFQAVAVGEDARFVQNCDPRKLLILDDYNFHVGIIHSENASPKRTSGMRWRTYDKEKVLTLMGVSASRFATHPKRMRPNNTLTSRSALVAAAYGIGDILRATPLVRALHELGYEIDFLVAADNPETIKLIDNHDYVRRAIQYNDFRANKGTHPIHEITGKLYDVAIFSYWARPLCEHVKASQVYAVERSEWLQHGDHECNRRIAQQLGWSGKLPRAFATHSKRDFALPTGTVALHPGCKADWPWKKWHGFGEIGQQLSSLVIIGSETDLDNSGTYFDKAFRWPSRARNYVGQLSLPDTAALLSQCSALLSNDSGIMQLGTALGVPTFGIFGITSPKRELIPQSNVRAITKGLACETSCHSGSWGRQNCSHKLKCLKTLTADEVLRSMSLTEPTTPRTNRRTKKESAMDSLSLSYYGYVFDASGYGRAARAYIHALHQADVKLKVVDLARHPRQVKDELVESLISAPRDSDLHLFHGIPSQWARMAFPLRNSIGMTVWETDTLPSQWRNALNHTQDVWVPSQFNVECFTSALEKPVFRLPHPVHELAVNGCRYPSHVDDWLGVAEEDFVYYSIFEWQDRKNPNGLIEAFLRAFPEADGPVLVIKTNPRALETAQQVLEESRRRLRSSARIVLRCEPWTDAEIRALHHRGNCYVSLHYGEGWCYPLFDATSLGTPVVATRYSGPLDFLGDDYPGLVSYDMAAVRQPYTYYSRQMRWAQPRLEDAVACLRWCWESYPEAKHRAEQTRESIVNKYSLQAVGAAAKHRLLDVLCRTRPRRGQRLRRQALAGQLRPSHPIKPEWYDADYFDQAVKSNWTEGYRWTSFKGLFHDTAQLLIEVFSEAESFLDAGCAKGFLVRTLREAGKDGWGCDHSKWALDHADALTKPYLIESCVTALKPDREFDVLIALNLFESLTEAQASKFLQLARQWTTQAIFAVILTVESDEDRDTLKYDNDLSRVTMQPRSWWHELFLQSGWRQDALHRIVQRTCQNHTLPMRMTWQVFVYSPR